MSKNTWNKKAIAVITVATFVGVLSPISANAWDTQQGPDEIITVSVDLGDGSGGGGGEDPDTCSGYSSLVIPSNSVSVAYESQTLKEVYEFVDDPNTDGWDNDLNLTNDTRNPSDIDVWNENTRTNYVSNEFTISYDADNCPSSTLWAYLNFERQPVERYNGFGWYPAEMTYDNGILEADELLATSNLILNRGIVNGNVATAEAFYDMPWDTSGYDSDLIGDWGTVDADALNPLEQVQGTSGDVDMRALLTLFGDEPKGKYRVKYGFNLWID